MNGGLRLGAPVGVATGEHGAQGRGGGAVIGKLVGHKCGSCLSKLSYHINVIIVIATFF